MLEQGGGFACFPAILASSSPTDLLSEALTCPFCLTISRPRVLHTTRSDFIQLTKVMPLRVNSWPYVAALCLPHKRRPPWDPLPSECPTEPPRDSAEQLARLGVDSARGTQSRHELSGSRESKSRSEVLLPVVLLLPVEFPLVVLLLPVEIPLDVLPPVILLPVSLPLAVLPLPLLRHEEAG